MITPAAVPASQPVLVRRPDGSYVPVATRPRRVTGRVAARRYVWRHRRHLAPLAPLAGWVVCHHLLTGHMWWATLTLTVGIIAVAPITDRAEDRPAYAVTATVTWVAWLWLTTATTLTDPWTWRITVTLWVLLSVPWWVRHQHRPTEPDVVESLAVARPATPTDTLAVMWQVDVAGVDGPLPGCPLTAPAPIPGVPHGLQGTISLRRKTLAEARAQVQRVAVALRVPHGAVEIEPAPSGLAHEARLIVTPLNPLQRTCAWDAPSYDPADGTYLFGLSLTGAPVRLRIVDPTIGPIPVAVGGAAGGGKTDAVKALMAELHCSPLHVLWVIDPQQGASFPEFREAVDWYAGNLDTARVMLRAAVRVMEARERLLAALTYTVTVPSPDGDGTTELTVTGYGRWVPTPGLPVMTPDLPELRIVVDELPMVIDDPDCQKSIAALLARGRKTGVSFVLASQMWAMDQIKDTSVRKLVTAGPSIACRASDPYMARQLGMRDGDPTTLPQRWPDGSSTAGLAYVAMPGESSVLSRARWTPNWWAVTTRPAAGRLDATSVEAAGEDYRASVTAWASPTPLPLPTTTPSPHTTSTSGGAGDAGGYADLLHAALQAAGRPMRWTEWANAAGVPAGSARNARRSLIDAGLVTQHKTAVPQDTTYSVTGVSDTQ